MSSDRRQADKGGAAGAPLRERRLMKSLGHAFGVRRSPLRPVARWADRNLGGGAGIVREELRHVFPDSWAFFLGEIALYCFIVLVVTGIYLALFFQASQAPVVYHGSYKPLDGTAMTAAYRSVVDISFHVRAGLLVRQVHHWAALVFVAALMIHLLRMFFTGAYRKPRVINWLIGLLLLLLVAGNGLFGYSLPDDLLSGVGLRVAYSITMGIPLIGPWLASVLFGGEFPTEDIIGRLYPVHIFLMPAGIAGLLGLHMGILWFQRHTEFPGPGRDDRTMVGTPMVPAYALRTTGYLLLVGGVLTAFGAFLQINPVWLYGPFNAWDSTTQAQPDWYMGWMEGGLRLMPGWDIHIGWFLLPAVFWPAVILPGLVFTPLFVWPFLDALALRDDAYHNVLTMPSERPGRVALGAGFVTFLTVFLLGGADDVFANVGGWQVTTLVAWLRLMVFVAPPLVALLTYAIFRRRARRWLPA
jgi:ubiquinol-cytochrome c reductase cytochrome b subunit